MKYGQRYGDPYGNTDATARFAAIDENYPDARTLSWTPEHSSGVVYKVMIDGFLYATTSETSLSNVPTEARDWIEIIEVSDQNFDEDLTNVANTPLDTAKIVWSETADADYYTLYRSLTSGSYTDAPIATIQGGESSYTYYDRALADDTYYYRLTVYDDADNTVNSNEADLTIDSAPEPPTNLTVSVANNTATLTWTASTSADVDHYNIYRGDPVEMTAAVLDTTADVTYADDVTGLTGHYEYLVRTEDTSGNEENNLSQMVTLDLVNGAQAERPNSPLIVDYGPVAGGEVTLIALYDRTGEVGTATVLNLYVNDGAGGAIDYNTSVGSGTLATERVTQVLTIDSSGLSGQNTYLCVVRAATSGGTEDTNTDSVSITTDSLAPGTPAITVTAV